MKFYEEGRKTADFEGGIRLAKVTFEIIATNWGIA